LTGDSFTWGYAPFDKKFGTILQALVAKQVLKCGITHSGQIHQFNKFKRVVRQLGYYPPVVVVNVDPNDLDNDFSHPHSIAFGSVLVDQVKIARLSDGTFRRMQLPLDELKSRYQSANSDASRGYKLYDPRRWSASAIVGMEIIKYVKSLFLALPSHFYRSRPSGKLATAHSSVQVFIPIYGPTALVDRHRYPIYSTLAERNRQIISKWVDDSNRNNYKLYFSFVSPSQVYAASFEMFIESVGARYCNFPHYLTAKGLNQLLLTWKHDGHFNIEGNSVYAQSLAECLAR